MEKAVFVLFATPFLNENNLQFIRPVAALEGVRVGVISQEPQEFTSAQDRDRFAGHWRVNDPLNADEIEHAARELSRQHGKAARLLAINEQIQVPAATVRERLGIEGMNAATVNRFRDKALMKETFRAHGVPCARSCRATTGAEARDFVAEVGFPVCIKPVDGAAAQSTYRVESDDSLRDVLRASAPSEARPLQIEEFVTGQEHSFECMSLNGKPLWHSLTRYVPTPLDVMRNPWIQWRIVLPREIDSVNYDDMRKVNAKALAALGMETGMTHMEWFRRTNGSIAVGEVGARPPGAQIVTITNRAHDMDLYSQWANLMVHGRFEPPAERKYAAGVAFLRGLGGGRVNAVHGMAETIRELGDMVTDYSYPLPGQPASVTYEGEGFICVRHPKTRIVNEALETIINQVRVELIN
jgi:biotin carboxylase